MAAEYIFVYGTLRRGTATGMHHLLQRRCQYISDGFMHGRLYEADGYPGAVESEDVNERVYGEIYAIKNNDALLRLDEYEECTDTFPGPHEYIRKECPIFLTAGGSVIAWAYIFNRDISMLEQIESGNYVSHMKTERKKS